MDSCQNQVDWNGLFVEHQARLVRTAFRVLDNLAWAQDVVQNTYLKLNEGSHACDAREPVAYLFRMVRNLAIDAYRRAALEASFMIDEECGDAVAASCGTPESLLASRQQLQLVVEALATLPERTRSAFELHRLGGLTQREIGIRLGVSITLVNVMIRDATTHCAKALHQPRSGSPLRRIGSKADAGNKKL